MPKYRGISVFVQFVAHDAIAALLDREGHNSIIVYVG